MTEPTAIRSSDVRKSRLEGLDLLKGWVMLAMAVLHAKFFFDVGPIGLPFAPFDAFVFSAFLFAFGVGNGLSRRAKRVKTLIDLTLATLVGGFVAHLSWSVRTGVPNDSLLTGAIQRLQETLLLQNRLSYADFLIPYVFHYTLLLLLQKALGDLRRTAVVVLVVSTSLLALGLLIEGARLPFAPTLNHGVRILQSAPLFWGGLLLGRNLAVRGVPKISATTGLASGAVATMVALGTFLVFVRPARSESWKASGDISYPLASLLFSLCALAAFQWLAQRKSAINDFFAGAGRSASAGLWMQLAVIPPLGAACAGIHSLPIRLAAATGVVAGVMVAMHRLSIRTPAVSRANTLGAQKVSSDNNC